MLVYRIKHPEPVVPARALPTPNAYQYDRGAAYGTKKCEWGKIQYSIWVEQVKLKFKKGDLVTLSCNVEVDGKVPYYYEIEGISEIHYITNFDEYYSEPMAIQCLTQHNFRLSKCPSGIRLLTEREIANVHLQHQANNIALC